MASFENETPTNLSVTSRNPSSDEQPVLSISGYLFKKSRDGRWQRRWFETTGCYLTYYKSKKMERLLAALSLPQVGEIALVTEPGEQSDAMFSIELNSRIYTLRAKDREEAEKWVDTLKKLRDQGILLNHAETRQSASTDSRMQSFQIDGTHAQAGKSKLLANEGGGSATWIKNQRWLCTWCCCFD